jgi:type IV secretory pathway protease TraF
MKLKNNQKKFLFASLVIICTGVLIASNYEVMRNHTESLSYKYVVIEKGKIPTRRGQVFAFKVYNNSQYNNEKPLNFIKLVGGLAGDEIEVRGGDIYFGENILRKDTKIDELTHEDFFHNFNLFRLIDPEKFKEKIKEKKITIVDTGVFVAGSLIGVVKPYSKKVEELINAKTDFDAYKFRLHAIESGKIPPHKFFAYTPHKDSFDSRYKEIGLIDEKDIIGTAVLTF